MAVLHCCGGRELAIPSRIGATVSVMGYAICAIRFGRTNDRRLSAGPGSQLCWFGFNAADRQVVRRPPTVPSHDHVGFST